jgi:DnaJ like chaperone protein
MSSSFNIPRHWWGKIIGATLGLMRGSLSGAIVGGLIGHFIDRFLAGITGVKTTQDAFFKALFSTLGHLAKADGQVTEVEIRMVESLMQQMNISGEDRNRAIRYFNAGKSSDFDLDSALKHFAQTSVVRQDLRQMFVEILVSAASSNGTITEAEQQVLVRVAAILRIPGPVLAAILNARTGGAYGAGAGQGPAWGSAGSRGGRQGYRQGAGGNQVQPIQQAYAALGLQSSASDNEVKKAYRKLVSQYHPDKLVARGLPEEMMDMAKTRVREINTAYDQIKQTRGFK